MLSKIIDKIEHIYSEFNIHKAIFVSFNYESTTKLFKRRKDERQRVSS